MKPPPPPPRRPPAPQGSTAADPVVLRLMAALRVHGMYPKNNPNVKVALARLREALAAFAPGEGVQLEIQREQIRFCDLPVLPAQPEVKDLAGRLYLAHIVTVDLLPEVTDDELVAVFDLLRLPQEERAKLGAVEDLLAARGVFRVFLKEFGRARVVEEKDEGESWDLSTLAEFEQLEGKFFGQMGRTEFQSMLRAVTGGQQLRASRLLALLERPRSFAQYLVDLASRVRVGDGVDLDAQLAVLVALLGRMETSVARLPEADRIHLLAKLEQVATWLTTALHKSILAGRVAPFVDLKAAAGLFPAVLHDLDLREAFHTRRPTSAAMAPLLMSALRRVQEGDGELAAFLNGVPAGGGGDPAGAAAYCPAALPMGAPDAPPRALPPDYLEPGSSGPSAALGEALGTALAAAQPELDLAPRLVDLLALEPDPAGRAELSERLVVCLHRALLARNLPVAGDTLAALAQAAPDAVERAASREILEAYVGLLGSLPPGGEEQRAAHALAARLGAPAVAGLLEILAGEPSRSARRRILDLLAAVAAPHRKIVAAQLGHASWFVVRNAVAILASFGPEGVADLLGAARHADPRVRKEVLRALGRSATAAGQQALLAFLEDPDEAVLREAVAKVAGLPGPAARAALNALLGSPRFAELEGETMIALARALTAVGDAESATLLAGRAEAKATRGWLRAPEVRSALRDASQAIGARAGGPR